jgi:hypothetical protein
MPRKKKISDSEEDFVVYDKTIAKRQTRSNAKSVSVIELLGDSDSEDVPKVPVQ